MDSKEGEEELGREGEGELMGIDLEAFNAKEEAEVVKDKEIGKFNKSSQAKSSELNSFKTSFGLIFSKSKGEIELLARYSKENRYSEEVLCGVSGLLLVVELLVWKEEEDE